MRNFRIRRLEDFDGSVHFILIYPETINPGEKVFEKRISIGSIGVVQKTHKDKIKETLEQAKIEFDNELTVLGVSS